MNKPSLPAFWDRPPPDRLPDEVLLAGLGAGDVDSAIAFVHRFERVVFGVAMTITGDPSTAEDIAQQAFEHARRHAVAYHPQHGPVRAWLTAMARDLAVDVVRARAAAPATPHDLAGLLTVMSGPPERRTAGRAAGRAGTAGLPGRLDRLPAPQARAVAMASLYGMTARQIAHAEGIPLGTARTLIRDGMRELSC
jgi:RNA polymerase sigma factor (sigma-70 family)